MRGTPIFVLIFATHVMHPLRFPNSGIRAKIFVRKIDFKLRVMRLNYVESFCVRSKNSEEEVRLAMVMPTVRGSRLRPKTPRRGSACGRRQHPRPGRRWQLPAARPQGAAPRPGLLPARATANRGSAHARRRNPPTRCCPRAAAPAEVAAVHTDDV
ncbi:hypothetical protein GW17_00043407 [Ensete ventricosum]|nr:hypothetical protein GW17_00043407 [Ensete ventricosum]